MRDVINISLPAELSKVVKKTIAKGNFATKSEFFRHLLRRWILAEELEESRRDLEAGRGKLLKSFKDLDKS